jgi:hypothetical protein
VSANTPIAHRRLAIDARPTVEPFVSSLSSNPAAHLLLDQVIEVPFLAFRPMLPSNPDLRLRADLVALYIPVLSIASTTLTIRALTVTSLRPYSSPSNMSRHQISPSIRPRGENDDGVVGTLDVAALVRVQDCGADGEQRGAGPAGL